MKVARDLAAGVTCSILSMAVALISVPFFIHYLGVETYGLIGFSITLQAALALLDLGLGPTISREIARAAAAGRITEARNLLRSMAWLYWPLAVAIGICLILLARPIAEDWLQPGALPQSSVVNALMLMAVQVAVRWPSALYLGALTGARRMVLSSSLSTAYFFVANVGAIAVLALWSSTIEAFFGWQVLAGLGYTLILQHFAWQSVGGSASARFDENELKQVWRFSAGVGGVALISLVITQFDKLILSRLLSLEAFGHYMLAVLAVSSLYRVVTPLFSTIYPKFSGLVAVDREEELAAVYRTYSNAFATIWYPGIMMLAICAEPLLTLWTGDAELAERSAPLLSVLALSTGVHGAMFFPYALQLAYGASRLTVHIHLLLVGVQIPSVLLLADEYGALGGAISALVVNITYFVAGTYMTHRRHLQKLAWPWVSIDIGRPVILATALGLPSFFYLSSMESPPLLKVALGMALALFTLVGSAAWSPYKLVQVKQALAE